jgi:hypothetical protein
LCHDSATKIILVTIFKTALVFCGKKVSTPIPMCHDSATKILIDFINIEKWYKRKNPANRWICRVYRFF